MYKDYAEKHKVNMFEQLMECIKSGEQKEFAELKYQERFLNIRISPFSGGAIITSIDTTDRRLAEDALQEKISQLHMILPHAPLVLSAVNLEGEFILSEGKGLETLGRKPGEFVGVSAFDLYKKSNPDIVEYIRRALSGESVNAIVELDGEMFDVNYEPIMEADGKITGVVAVSNIITERKQREE
jgi:PAS domain S-box-containing protein